MLTDAQLQTFETDGVLVVPDVLPPALLSRIRAEYMALMDALYDRWAAEGRVPAAEGRDFWDKLRTAYAAGCDWFQPMDITLPADRVTPHTPFHFGPAVFDMLRCPAILDIVEQLIGSEITSNPIQHVRLKPPARTLDPGEVRAHVGGTDWHQDRAVAHASADRTRMVTVWLAITDATVENGCLQAVPGKPRMYPHCPQKQTSIAKGMLDESRALPLPVKAGGMVLLHPLTPHSALDNMSDQFRWSFDLRYNVTGAPTGRDHFPSFIARSRARPEAELTDWKAWEQMWLDARARLSRAPPVELHRWQADAPVCA